ncbi:MAG: Uma2 family endonuclease [Shackletoniella antarctica]|uniref:Uma2 family endonuclease n=1 Tax=Shackletoniella antarctica TaxID=268115 RepID=A0A2W4Y1A5_9CYAN|nr:MAG: Uma2 family endonuclease [Shackletoniella antarctica]
MVTSAPNPQTNIALGEKRVTLRGLDWQAYQEISQALPPSRAARFTYDRSTLEITMPLEDHEFAVRLIELFIRILVVEQGLKIKTLGSTTLNREDLDRGAEPDNAYYIQNQSLVAGKTIDLKTDPPPDLVVEVDITHTDIDKLSLYANLGVPEFWRYNGKSWGIYHLKNAAYQEVEISPTFPGVVKAKLYEFLAQAKLDEVEAEANLRQWLRSISQVDL